MGLRPLREGRPVVKIVIIVLAVIAVLFVARMIMARSR